MIILGDNPFFGVNHASVRRSNDYYARLRTRDWSAAHATMIAARARGVDHFMVSTHAEAPDLLASMREIPELRDFAIIPAVPYLHRLNGVVAAKGVPTAVLQSMSYLTFFKEAVLSGSLPAAALAGFIAREVDQISSIGFQVPAIALQNIFVDLLLGLGQADFLSEVGRRMQANGRQLIAISMNPILADRLLDPSIVICTHYNVLGYFVQPNLQDFRSWLAGTSRKMWAMGVMSSGKAKLADVLADPCLHRFDGVVIGASRPASIQAFAEGYAAQH